jgi:hypothetical protein
MGTQTGILVKKKKCSHAYLMKRGISFTENEAFHTMIHFGLAKILILLYDPSPLS